MEKAIVLTEADSGKSAEMIREERGTLGTCHVCQERPATTRHGPILICESEECTRYASWEYDE